MQPSTTTVAAPIAPVAAAAGCCRCCINRCAIAANGGTDIYGTDTADAAAAVASASWVYISLPL